MLKTRHDSDYRCSGQALVEYALILLLFTIVVLIVVTNLGQSNDNEYARVNDSLEQAGYGR